MKKMNDDILKYLSGLMTEEKIKEFEKEISNSDILKKEFISVKDNLNNLKSVDVECLDERYFHNLLPNIYNKLEQKKKKSYKFAYYVVPIAASIIVFILMYPPKNGVIEFSTQSITKAIVDNLDDESISEVLLTDYSLENSIAFSSSQINNFDTGLPEEINFTNGELINMIDMAMLDYTKSTYLTSNDLENIYQKIK